MSDDTHKRSTYATRPTDDEHGQDDVPKADSALLHKKNEKKARPPAWLVSLFHTNQQPKAVAVRDRSKAFAQALIHLPSIGVTFGVLSLSFRTVFWQAPAPNMNSILNALQFAAKLHETLILMSLSAIVLHRTRYDLLGPRGVSLGLLSSGSQLNSWGYIFSPEFFGGITKRNLSLTGIILSCFILAGLSGPSSAITMIPRLDWWNVPDVNPKYQKFTYYIKGTLDEFFPETLHADRVPLHCYQSNATGLSDCPSAGFSTIQQSSLDTPGNINFLSADSGLPTNISMTAGTSEMLRYLGGTVETPALDEVSLYAASSVPDFMASALVYYWQDLNYYTIPRGYFAPDPLAYVSRAMVKATIGIDQSESNIKKPFVQVACGGQAFGRANIYFPHMSFDLAPSNGRSIHETNWNIPNSTISRIAKDEVNGDLNFTWVDLSSYGENRPSLAGVFTLGSMQTNDPFLVNTIIPCVVDARWVPIDMWIDPTVESFIRENLPNPKEVLSAANKSTSLSYPSIYIDLNWADSLNVKPENSTLTAIEMLGSTCAQRSTNTGDEHGVEVSRCLGAMLALYLTDGISRFQNPLPQYLHDVVDGNATKLIIDPRDPGNPIAPENNTTGYESWASISSFELLNPSNYTQISFVISQFGYGYSFRGVTIYLATAVLLLHVFLVLIHMSIVMSGGWTSSAWGRAGEYIVLAMNSKPTDLLRDTCVGISTYSAWNLRVRVRDTGDDHLELVFSDSQQSTAFEDSGSSQQPILGKKYA